ncbi:MAG: TonB family protein [Bacteroidota bacterium]
MANDNHIKTFTATDIEKYYKGLLSAKEMHDLEKAALDDPFLADALEGYATPGVNVSADIAELKKRLADKTEQAKVIPIGTAASSSFPWLRAAVMIVVIAGAGLLSYQFLFKTKTNDIAQAVQKKDELAKTKKPIITPAQGNATDTISSSASASTLSKPGNKNQTENIPVKQNTRTKEATGNAGSVSQSARGDVANTDVYKDEPVTTNAPAKTEEKTGNETKKSLRNDNAFDKSSVTEKSDAFKAKELSLKRKAEPNADGIADKQEKEAVVTKPGLINNNRNNQGYVNNTNNYFRGRVTDANNNALPFANITNTTDNVGTYSDAKGYFTLVSPDSVLNVQVRSLGFENSTTRLRNNVTNNQVVMQDDRSLAEVVVNNKKVNSNRSRDANMKFEEPEPADGWESYDTYLANNLNIPEKIEPKKPGGSGEVEISFEVNKDGEPINIRVEKSLCDKCDKEAIRLIKEGPKWKRKAKKGKRTTVTVPFN